jgi:hypothetical protein
MSEETKTRPASEANQFELPKLTNGSWEWTNNDIKYKLREATIGEIAEASAGARSEKEDLIRKLSIVTQQQNDKDAWVPLEWPKDNVELFLNELTKRYYLGLAAKSVQTKNLSKPTSAATPQPLKSDGSAKPSM